MLVMLHILKFKLHGKLDTPVRCSVSDKIKITPSRKNGIEKNPWTNFSTYIDNTSFLSAVLLLSPLKRYCLARKVAGLHCYHSDRPMVKGPGPLNCKKPVSVFRGKRGGATFLCVPLWYFLVVHDVKNRCLLF
jgi:hypothetical protein